MPIPDFHARNFLVVLLAGLVGMVACAISPGDLGEYTDTDAPKNTTENPGESGGTAPTSTDGMDDPDGPEAPSGSCEEKSNLNEGWNVVMFEPDITEQDFAADCEVTGLQPEPAFVFVACLGRAVRIGVGDADISQVAVGEVLAFDYRRRNLSHYENWFTLRRTDVSAELVLAGINAASLTPPNAADFFAPLHLTPSEGVCPTTPTCDAPFEKIAVEFAHEGGTVALLPPITMTIGEVARYQLGVGEARDNHVELTDVPTGSCDLSDFSSHNYTVHVVLTE